MALYSRSGRPKPQSGGFELAAWYFMRLSGVEPSDIPSAFYWVRPRPYDKTTWIDQFDNILLGQLGDPTSPTARQHAIAAARQKDIILLNALGGTRYTGAQGTSAQALPSTGGVGGTGQTVAVTYGSGGANSGLQLAKLTQASFMVKNNEKQFQRFQLPDDAKLWGCYVNGQPAKPERSTAATQGPG